MIKILFVCHGNICRSPMAEFVLKQKVNDLGRSHDFEIASAATSTEEIGNPVYPPVKSLLQKHGISCKGKTAQQITPADYKYYDHIIAMDNNNVRNLKLLLGDDSYKKITLLLDYTNTPRDVADPWYTRDFEQTWNDIQRGCDGFLDSLIK